MLEADTGYLNLSCLAIKSASVADPYPRIRIILPNPVPDLNRGEWFKILK